MKFTRYVLGPLLLVSVISIAITVTGEVAWSAIVRKAEKAADGAMVSAKMASLSRDVALEAFENAMAAHDTQQARLMKALKTGDKKKIADAKNSVKEAAIGSDEAGAIVEKIVGYTGEAVAAAASARDEAARASSARTETEAVAALEKAEHLAGITADLAGKADALASQLRKKWLTTLAMRRTTSTISTTTTTQPSPTPVGKR